MSGLLAITVVSATGWYHCVAS